ncbi:hypothetical protein NBRC116584_03990 [Hydrogenophaga sp. 5NK40-0174]
MICSNLVETLHELVELDLLGTAESEEEAVTWLLKAPSTCNLMIIDVFLKSGTGIEVLRQARQKLPKAALVVLTNYATADMRKRCLKMGADRVFDKSAELEELLEYCEEVAHA